MKVCAHINLSPYQHIHRRFDHGHLAVTYFRNALEKFYGSLEGIIDRTGEDRIPTVDIYPQCDDCNSQMNFHDWPMARFQIGPKGGIRRIKT